MQWIRLDWNGSYSRITTQYYAYVLIHKLDFVFNVSIKLSENYFNFVIHLSKRLNKLDI